MNWITLAMISLLITSGNSILDKRLMKGRKANPFACVASFGIPALPVVLVGLWLLPPIPWSAAYPALAAGLVFVAAAWLYYDTVGRVDISRLVPLLRLTAVQTLLLAVFFLDESLSVSQIMAFAVMLASGVLLSLKWEASTRFAINRAALRIIPVTTLLAANSVLTAFVYRTTSVWHGIVWENLGILLGLAVLGLSLVLRRGSFSHITGPATWGVLAIEQSTRLFSKVISGQAIVIGAPVAILSALSGFQLLWVWLLAALVLHERTPRKEIPVIVVGMIGMGVGIYLLL